MDLLTFEDVKNIVSGKRVAIIGSGPSCTSNDGRKIDEFDFVVRINNYKIKGFESKVGTRTDIYYSFFGGSIRKSAEDLKKDGVKICMSKLPDAKVMESEWHRKNGKEIGIDFRMHYRRRSDWWFCPVYVPTIDRFMNFFSMLDRHIPTTGFQCMLEFFDMECNRIYITGFDGFRSGVHNVNERWRLKNPDDPIGHRPDIEMNWLKHNMPANVVTDDHLKGVFDKI